MTSLAILQATETFVAGLKVAIADRVRELAVARIDRLRAMPQSATLLSFARPRKKAPIQLCPAPGCANRAAPVFGMLCAAHKDTDKATVRAWRAARRLRKAAR